MYEITAIEQLYNAHKNVSDEGVKNHIRRAALRQLSLMMPVSRVVDQKAVMDREIRRIYQTEGKIPAIKYHRSKTGYGLKESKEYVEALCPDIQTPRLY